MNINIAMKALQDLRKAVELNNTILIRIYIKRLSKVVDLADLDEDNIYNVADHIIRTVDKHILILVGLKLKGMYDQLGKEEITLADVYHFIDQLRIDDKYDNLKDLKRSAIKAFNANSYPLMQLSIARALNLSVSKRPQKRSKITQDGLYMGSTGKGFKTERGAKMARTKYLKKHGVSVHHGEYGIVKVGDVFAIQFP